MCDECQFGGCCAVQDGAARLILLAGEFSRMVLRARDLTRDCELFVPRERRRYA